MMMLPTQLGSDSDEREVAGIKNNIKQIIKQWNKSLFIFMVDSLIKLIHDVAKKRFLVMKFGVNCFI